MASQKVQKLITFDRKAIIKMLDLNKPQAQRVMDMEMPSLKTKKAGVPATNKDGFPRKIPGYMLYCNAFRDEVRGEDGKVENPQQAMKEAAAKWKTFSDDEKKPWLDKATENFEKAKEEFLKEHPDYEDSKKTKKVKKVPKVKPVVIKAPRTKSAKQFFTEEFKSKTDLKGNIALGEAEKAWLALSEDEKEPYNTAHQKTKDEVDAFKEFAKGIKDESLAAGVEDTMKALRNDAAKRWHELKNSPPQNEDLTEITGDLSESDEEKPESVGSSARWVSVEVFEGEQLA